MRLIGLTGPSGTGKSSIKEIAENLGYFVIDCDKTARQVATFPEVFKKLETAFSGVVKNGILDRSLLANRAFSSREETEKLNSIMLPAIVDEIKAEVTKAQSKGYKICLLDAPTLYESGLDKECEAVIAVLADLEKRSARIAKRDKLSAESLEKRLNAAKPDEFYKQKAEHIIYNNGSVEEYFKNAAEVLKKLSGIGD